MCAKCTPPRKRDNDMPSVHYYCVCVRGFRMLLYCWKQVLCFMECRRKVLPDHSYALTLSTAPDYQLLELTVSRIDICLPLARKLQTAHGGAATMALAAVGKSMHTYNYVVY